MPTHGRCDRPTLPSINPSITACLPPTAPPVASRTYNSHLPPLNICSRSIWVCGRRK
ncbi:hypothetical protein B0T17DRAFT_513725 [Bombardia bombarda]|uniref:Uncharacterized protein n=1 Tax=Bombardia bombarda TaxID=252184 RepID=A0AA39XIE3_9PEZI|nr:hypothetical protein B0T17DRAFT_513725 [Bombardia bombarda]